VDLYSTLHVIASNVLPFSVGQCGSLLASPFSQAIGKHCETTHTGWDMACDMPVYSPSFHWVLILACHRGQAQAE